MPPPLLKTRPVIKKTTSGSIAAPKTAWDYKGR